MRNLAAQADAIWPQDGAVRALPAAAARPYRGHRLRQRRDHLATRPAVSRAEIVGVDILESSVALRAPSTRCVAPRVGSSTAMRSICDCRDTFRPRRVPAYDAGGTGAGESSEGVCRICRPGGWVHVLSEDYGMLHAARARVDPDRLWHEGVMHSRRDGDGCAHRSSHLDADEAARLRGSAGRLYRRRHHAGPRATFAAIIAAWRDGYTEALGRHTALGAAEVRALFDYVVDAIADPDQYVVWHIPIVSGRKPL